MDCLAALQKNTRENPSEAVSDEEIRTLLQRDSFFEEQTWPNQCLQTLGQMHYIRNTLLDLQSTANAVHAMADTHRKSIDIATVVASSVLAEASNWRAIVKALRKAKEAEKAAQIKREPRVLTRF